jgi:membrane fusion protein, multidrug efflux system
MDTAAFTTEINEAPHADRPAIPLAQPELVNHANRFELGDEANNISPAKYRPPSFKRMALVAAMALAVVGGSKLVYDWRTVGRFMESTDDAYVGGDVTALAPKVAGFISQIAVVDNQPVRAGDLLLKLDDRDYRAALARAEASFSLQQAALTNLDAMRHLQEAVIVQAQAGVTSADAETTRTHDDQIRFKQLVSERAVSMQEFQKADTDYKKALADGEKSRATLMATQRQLDVIATQKQQAQAALDAAIAERSLAQLNLSYTELRAPMDGVVGNRSAQVGAYVTVGSQLISIVPTRGLWIDANFKENQLAQMRAGAPATVKIDLLGGKSLRGHVVSFAPATGSQFSVLPVENATGNFTKIVQRVTVRIKLDDEAATLGWLRPGLSVTAKVNTQAKAGL